MIPDLVVTAGTKDEVKGGVRTPRPGVGDLSEADVFGYAIDSMADLYDIARSIKANKDRRKRLIEKLDDPANADDPRRADAEKVAFRCKFIMEDDLKKFDKLAMSFGKKIIDSKFCPEIALELGNGFRHSTALRLIERRPGLRDMKFWAAVLYARDEILRIEAERGDPNPVPF